MSGLHTIAWIVTDSAGQTSGIGSRYFIIDNSGGGSSDSMTPDASASAAESMQELAEADVSLRVRVGIDEREALLDVEASDGRRRVVARELDLIEIRPSGEADRVDGWRYRGYHVVGSNRRALPVGSTLDAATGRFSWQPSAGFVGSYALQFVRTSADGREEQFGVEVVIEPLHRGGPRTLR